jgi:hypothetical protein
MLIFYRSAKNRQVTHHYYGLSCFLHAPVSERIERGHITIWVSFKSLPSNSIENLKTVGDLNPY